MIISLILSGDLCKISQPFLTRPCCNPLFWMSGTKVQWMYRKFGMRFILEHTNRSKLYRLGSRPIPCFSQIALMRLFALMTLTPVPSIEMLIADWKTPTSCSRQQYIRWRSPIAVGREASQSKKDYQNKIMSTKTKYVWLKKEWLPKNKTRQELGFNGNVADFKKICSGCQGTKNK